MKKVCTKVKYVNISRSSASYAVVNTTDDKHAYYFIYDSCPAWIKLAELNKARLEIWLKKGTAELLDGPPTGVLPFVHPNKVVTK